MLLVPHPRHPVRLLLPAVLAAGLLVAPTTALAAPSGGAVAADEDPVDIIVEAGVRKQGSDAAFQHDTYLQVGDTAEYQAIVGNPTPEPVTDISVTADGCDAPPQFAGTDPEGDNALAPGEQWRYTCLHTVTAGDTDGYYGLYDNWFSAIGHRPDGGLTGGGDNPPVHVIDGGIDVSKDGPDYAYPGDQITYRYEISNRHNESLDDITLSDDGCADMSGPQFTAGDDDGTLDAGEAWTYSCRATIPSSHKAGDENPIDGTATASGLDEFANHYAATADHPLQVLHPQVTLTKSAPAQAAAGSVIAYTLAVGNPGDMPFAEGSVDVLDELCDREPERDGIGSDATPGSLDPGDQWTYTCSVATAGHAGNSIVNRARVSARDKHGHEVVDSDAAATTLTVQPQPPSAAPPARTAAPPTSHKTRRVKRPTATARITGPSGCVRSVFTATVRGRQIRHVTFARDGVRVGSRSAKGGQSKVRVHVNPGREQGVHKLTARVRFSAASAAHARTLRLSYQVCPPATTPHFTG